MSSTILSPISATEDILRSTSDLRIIYDPPAEGPADGEYVDWSSCSLSPELVLSMQIQFPEGLYRHQHAAIEKALTGANTVVATKTSSGKSLTFALPALDAVYRDPSATTLFLYPQKALAADQLIKLQELVGQTDAISSRKDLNPFFVSRYDGSTPTDDRKEIRDQARMLLTNPDMLHFMLSHHATRFQRFFSNLKFVAIDECHEYRGVFGTGVAHVLRRLVQVCQMHGTRPIFIASSATIAEPQQHLERMVGEPFELVGGELDGSKQGRRKFWMVDGDDHYYDIGRKLATNLANQGLSVLAFCPSRVTAERMLAKLRKSDGSYDDHVAVYRSGLSPDEREDIEQGLRNKTKRLVFSTTALELGIDIGELDVVLCVGLPTSMMSLWQRAGRVARAGKEGAIILVPGNSPIESHYAQHPEEFFARRNETICLNMSNARLACQHYVCARDEVGGDEANMNVPVLGDAAEKIRDLRRDGKLTRPEFFCSDPHGEVNLRNSGGKSYRIQEGSDDLGEIGVFHLLRETPRNAIYRHGGRTLRVVDIVRGKNIVVVRPEFTRNETVPFIRKDIAVRQVLRIAEYSSATVAVARLEVSEYLMSLTERNPKGNIVQTWPGSAGMPSHKLPTEGTILSIGSSFEADLRRRISGGYDTAIASCERLLAGLFPTITGPCDSQDYSSGVTRLSTGELAIVLYDMVYDGVDLTSAAMDHMLELVQKAADRVRSCDCLNDSGCIRCVVDPRQDQPSSKSATLLCLDAFHDLLAQETPRMQTFTDVEDQSLCGPLPVVCTACNNSIPSHSKFCSNCGTSVTEPN